MASNTFLRALDGLAPDNFTLYDKKAVLLHPRVSYWWEPWGLVSMDEETGVGDV